MFVHLCQRPKLDTRHLKDFSVMLINDSIVFAPLTAFTVQQLQFAVGWFLTDFIKNNSGQTYKWSWKYQNFNSSVSFISQKCLYKCNLVEGICSIFTQLSLWCCLHVSVFVCTCGSIIKMIAFELLQINTHTHSVHACTPILTTRLCLIADCCLQGVTAIQMYNSTNSPSH